jgi:hypothetical protein
MGKSAMEGQVADEVLSLFCNGIREARKRYRLFVADGIPQGKREDLGSGRRMTKELLEEMNGEPFNERILGSGDFVRELRMRKELESKFPPPLDTREIVARVCSHFGLNPEKLWLTTRSARITDARSVICYLAVRLTGHSGVEVGRQVNLRRAGVSVAASRGEIMAKEDPTLIALLDK